VDLAGLLQVLAWQTTVMNASFGRGTVPHNAESLRALLAACVEDFAFDVLRSNPKGRAVPKLSSYLLSAKVGVCLARTNPAVGWTS
jgi:hypothetical protein